MLTQGLIDLQLLTGTVDANIETEAHKPFTLHGTSHWIGLDVHDAGPYRETVFKPLPSAEALATELARNASSEAAAKPPVAPSWPLQPGMILTVEPGLYFPACATTPERFHNIGIRIEDDVLVTDSNPQVLTNPPKTVAAIEAVMKDAKA